MADETNHKFSPIRLIEDQPMDDIDKDYLGLSPWAKMIAGTAVGTPGPFTIGVHGVWGYGKTTLLKLSKAFIDRNHPDVVTVWFNAWQFEREEHPLFPLIAAIADEIERKTAGSKKGKERLKSIGLSLRALTRGMKFKGEVGMPLVGKVGVEFDAQKALEAEDLLGKQTNPLQAEMMYHSAFSVLEDATKREANDDGAKIVVFMDDLDRCQPDKAVFLLESIKLILAQPGFIFVLAVDRSVIENYLEKRYVALCGDKIGDRGRFYMEKIIQLPIQIPSHRSRFGPFVKRIVRDLQAHHGETEMRALTAVQGVLATGSGSNPRSLVRLVNNFLLDCKLWPLIGQDEQYRDLTEDIAAALAFNRILQHELRDQYGVLVGDQELCDAIRGREIEGIAEGPGRRDQEEEHGTDGSLGPHWLRNEESRVSVARVLLARPELLEALREHGRLWLVNADLRRIVHEFAQVQRADAGPVDLPEPIARAIRGMLELQPDDDILPERLAEVTLLRLDRTQVTDANLAHLNVLPSLIGLTLRDTQVTDAGLSHLGSLSNLRGLVLTDTQVTDAGLAHLKGLSNLENIFLSGMQITDAGLLHLAGLPNLLILGLSDTQVTDAGLAHLKGLTSLQGLNLKGMQVTDAGLACLKELPNLRELALYDLQVTDDGLAHLEGLSNLRLLVLHDTQVTDAGTRMLEKAVPGLKIIRQ